MLTALMLLGLVSGSGYLLSNATAVRKHAPSTRNLSTLMPSGNMINAKSNPVPDLNLYNGQVFDANALKLVNTRNASHIAVPNYVTDSFNAYGGTNDQVNVIPNNSVELIPKRETTRDILHPAALLGGGVLVGGVGAAAAGRMLNKRSMKNAHSGKKGKKKKMNGVLRNLLDAPVSAGVRSRQR